MDAKNIGCSKSYDTVGSRVGAVSTGGNRIETKSYLNMMISIKKRFQTADLPRIEIPI